MKGIRMTLIRCEPAGGLCALPRQTRQPRAMGLHTIRLYSRQQRADNKQQTATFTRNVIPRLPRKHAASKLPSPGAANAP
jgi:hypothetical protein